MPKKKEDETKQNKIPKKVDNNEKQLYIDIPKENEDKTKSEKN